MSEFAVVPFEERHRAWVMDSFRRSVMDCWPWSAVPAHLLLEDLRRNLMIGRTVVAVAADDPDSFLGWASTLPAENTVVMAFVKYAVRRMAIGSGLVLATGVDLTRPTGVRYWTRAAERIGRKPGYRLFHRVTDDLVAA